MSFVPILFGISLGYSVYIVALYPLALAMLARLKERSVGRAPYFPSVSVVMAVYNGAVFLPEKLQSIRELDYPLELLQIIVVDDGSTDETRAQLEKTDGHITVIYGERAGKAGALNRGVGAASGEIVVFTDVRQRLARDSLRLLLENFADARVGAVSAELQIATGSTAEQESVGAYWKYERSIRLNLSAIDSIFGATGSFYAIRRNLVVPIPHGTLLDDMYVPLHAFFRGYRLIVDNRAQMFDYPTGLASEFGRKVRTLAGNYQILRSYPQLLGPRNRLWIHYMSYKFGRLLLPFALLMAAGTSLACGGALARLSGLAQLAAYAAAFADPYIREKTVLKRITSPIRTVLVMMLATACAVSIWFVPPERLWRTTRVARPDLAT